MLSVPRAATAVCAIKHQELFVLIRRIHTHRKASILTDLEDVRPCQKCLFTIRINDPLKDSSICMFGLALVTT